jgi:hypothetical protein
MAVSERIKKKLHAQQFIADASNTEFRENRKKRLIADTRPTRDWQKD